MELLKRHLLFIKVFIISCTLFSTSCSKNNDNSDLPVLITYSVTTTDQNTTTSGGNITFNGGSEITSRGVCWSTEQYPTTDDNKTIDGSGTGSFTSTLTNLESNTTYHIKAYATNRTGTGYGNEISFTTQDGSGNGAFTVKDIDGNIYQTVVIGTQTWMAYNLKTTVFTDGSPIQYTPETEIWARMTSPAYCWYANDEDNKEIFGGLYNWYTISSGKLAPEGWHIPSRAEWITLIDYLGGEEEAGGKMKEEGFVHWENPNTEADNSSGFTALPGGGRYGFCSGFHDILKKGYWWTATPSDTSENAYFYYLDTNSGSIDNGDDLLKAKIFGFSVRCIKD